MKGYLPLRHLVFSYMLFALVANTLGQELDENVLLRFRRMSERAENQGLSEPFKGVTTNGEVRQGLFTIHATGVSTKPVRQAADAFLASLNRDQREVTIFEIDDPEWRKWMNQHFYIRQGMGFNEMTDDQRNAAFGLLRASLSAKGLKLARDIMRLNHALGEMNNNNFAEYGEWLYWITVMGTPSRDEPWGWQIDGHHLIINYFVLGDQVVMTPAFFGSEPVIAKSGKHEGVSVLQEEQKLGLFMLNALNPGQRKEAILEVSKNGNNNLSEAFKDNLVLDYTGTSVGSFSDVQQRRLLDLIKIYINNMDEGHAGIKMDEVEEHLDETYFAWIGGTGEESVYYYRIHSPVVLIEFDHQRPAGLRGVYPAGEPNRQHIHTVVRTPNGNDYGKDLLRQHYEKHPHHQ